MLWETVIHSVRPLSRPAKNGKEPGGQEPPVKPRLLKTVSESVGGGISSKKQNGGQMLNTFDAAVYRKIARGHVHIEARVDLHGFTQKQAYSLLLRFLQSVQHRGLRHVLVITGKGSSSDNDGVLRQAVPHWLATAPFHICVHAFETAARHHGGTGALYVRLRPLPGQGG